MAEIGSSSGITQADVEAGFLSRFQAVQGDPTATADTMYNSVFAKNLLKSVYDTFVAAYNLTISDIQNAIAALQSAVASSASSYVTSSILTTANLLSTYPPSSSNVGKYARVSDLYGSVDDIMRCRYDGTNYRWVPQRTEFVGSNAIATGTLTLTPLMSPPTIRLTGGLTGNVTVSPSSTNAYNGQRFRIVNNATLGIFTTQISGLIGSNVTILGGGSRDIEFSASGWFSAT